MSKHLALFSCLSFTVLAGLACGPLTETLGPPPSGQETAAEPADARAEPLTVVRKAVSDSEATVATLSNGLTVILRENHNLPVVTVRAVVRAGGMYEGQWLGCGLSHLLEHLVAEGATRGAGHAAASKSGRNRLDAIGAQSNAYTSLAKTVYYISCAAGRTGDAIDIMADWMARPNIARADFDREHGVVQRELEMGRDEPDRQMWYAHAANFYRTHPAATPVIGRLAALKSVTYEDVLAYHGKMYTPQRMVLVVVGDVDSDEILRRICKALAGFESRRSPPTVLPEVPRLAGVRRVRQTSPAVKDVRENISFRTIPLVHPDLYALDVLSHVLTNGASSRLHRIVLREKKLVTAISSGSWTPAWGAGQFMIDFRAEPDKADEAESEVLAQLRRMIEEGVTEEELDKAKRQKVADHVYGQQSVESQASTLVGDFMTTGDVEFSRHYTDRIQAVTAEQVRQMARKYIRLDAMAVTRMTPASAASSGEKGAGEARTTKTERLVLPNGLTVVLHATETVDLVAMNLAARGGVLVEDDAINGLGMLASKLSIKGAGERSADQIAEFFDRAGGGISATCGNNTFMWRATVLKADALEALSVLADVVVRPTYPQKELEILRPSALAGIRRVDERWSSQMQRHFRQKFFPDSPWRMLPIGSLEVVANATPEAIAGHHERWIKGGASVLSIFGNFDVRAMRQAVQEHFADMPAGTTAVEIPPRRRVAPDGERHVLTTDNQVAAIMIGWPGMRLAEARDRDVMTVLDTIVSGYHLPSGWLHTELREKRLVYVVHAYNWAGLAPGAFIVYANAQPDKAAEVVRIIRRNVQRTLTHPFTNEEIDRAVNSVLTAELLDNQTMSALAMQATLDELYGFGYDYHLRLEERLRAVTPADLTGVAGKYLAGDAVETITTPAPQTLGPTAKAEGTQRSE